ncbi:hypothetical protein F7Q99_11155 [Streptomyces kaniharaensis]|uniref:Uncharacterized protein n=1 Tax=Streptomyces kaniharaensis TaxID=212423 RepID=A0A6N7KQ33_9ACTN|nr:hypothetical protein [Streptomyces kaniharaensis]MQS12835.1 hypothetical protein [Streptomyces kaniharaensis]
MSSSDNVARLARRIQKLTGLQLWRARELAKQVRVFVKDPIPDAASPAQRRLEAMVVHTLANTFGDRQCNGSVLGVVQATCSGDDLTLHLDPEMADEAVGELLPRWDLEDRTLRGVPGARSRLLDGQFIAQSVLFPARIILARADGVSLRRPNPLPQEVVLEVDNPALKVEAEKSANWSRPGPWDGLPEVRDLLLSRILRRPGLVNRAAATHGVANCYTHGESDLVIEWCCGDGLEAFFAALLAHGVADGLPVAEAATFHRSSKTAMIGGRAVVLRRRGLCAYEDDFDVSTEFTLLSRAEAVR